MSRLDANEIRALYGETPDAPTPVKTEAVSTDTKPEFRPAINTRTNKYAGRCTLCSTWVDAEAGLLSKTNGSWTVTHKAGECETPEPRIETKRDALDFVKRINQYAGRCDRCGDKVEERAGTVEKADDGKWVVSHKDGECPASDFPFPLGRYAVDTDEGHLAFYQVTRKGLYVQASDTLHRVQANAQEAIIAKIEADPEEASRTYGRELGMCGVCGRTLTDEISRAAGIGPVCAGRGWAV